MTNILIKFEMLSIHYTSNDKNSIPALVSRLFVVGVLHYAP